MLIFSCGNWMLSLLLGIWGWEGYILPSNSAVSFWLIKSTWNYFSGAFFCLSVAEIQKENGRSLEVRAVSHVIQRLEINTLLRCISGFQAHLAEEPVFQSWGLRRSKNEGRQQYHPPASLLDWRRAECQPLSRRPPDFGSWFWLFPFRSQNPSGFSEF